MFSLTRHDRSVESRSSELSAGHSSSLSVDGAISEVSQRIVFNNEDPFTGKNSESRGVNSAKERDVGVQCELDVPVANKSNEVVGKAAKVRECTNCGISFDDDVMFSIHMGMHNLTDPFVCNLCGHPCGNRYAFYTHIMRGHRC